VASKLAKKQRIRVRGASGAIEGKTWESGQILRAGRLESLEIVLDDPSVSRRHAEIRASAQGWQLRDLDSTNGTFLNGTRIVGAQRKLKPEDVIHFGKISLVVDVLDESPSQGGAEDIVVEATTASAWELALEGIAYDRNRCLRPGDQLQALLRASHSLGHVEREDDLLHAILNDVVQTLDAQRGAIVLADGAGGELRLRALASGRKDLGGRPQFSHSLAQRSFNCGESILCGSIGDDPELSVAQSIHEGAMASALCVLLRTPRKRLGVLHLDRSIWQKPFTKDDLHLADAMAASASAGIEIAQLLRQQRETFLNTITALAQAVEMHDEYTGGHTLRVTRFAQILGEQLKLVPRDLDLIRIGTPLHDIGKIGIGEAILRNPNRLTPAEFEIMKTHTVKGAAMLAKIPDLVPVIPIVRSHHEQWNGRGYPDGLTGEEIPRLARIVAVADAFDAMTSDRPYRRGMSPEAAFEELQRQSGKQFDPECATGFLAIRDRVVSEMQKKPAAGGIPATSAIGPGSILEPNQLIGS
jgi:putative nucleotidyltransferase with HDIG domain